MPRLSSPRRARNRGRWLCTRLSQPHLDGFSNLCPGIYAADSLGRIEVTDYRSQIRCGGVTVDQGDLIIADYDGIVAIPAAVADDVVRLAEEKVKDEMLFGQNSGRECLSRRRFAGTACSECSYAGVQLGGERTACWVRASGSREIRPSSLATRK